jgi:acyl carrier protein
MPREEVLAEVIEIVRRFVPADKNPVIAESSAIVADLGVNSLLVLDLVLALEDRYGVSIDDETLETIRTVGDVVGVVMAHQRP